MPAPHHVYVLPATGYVVVRTGPRGDEARRPTYNPDKLDAIERSAETGAVIRVGEGSYAIVGRRKRTSEGVPGDRHEDR